MTEPVAYLVTWEQDATTLGKARCEHQSTSAYVRVGSTRAEVFTDIEPRRWKFKQVGWPDPTEIHTRNAPGTDWRICTKEEIEELMKGHQ